MKKLSIAMGLMLAAFILTNCANEEIAATPNIGKEYTIQVDFAPMQDDFTPMQDDSRTSLDPATNKVAWDASDELLVFIQESGVTPTTWTPYKFTTTAQNAAAGRFSCANISISADKSYDWYVMSNYTAADPTKYMKNPISGTFLIGNQTQTGASTAHLTAADGIVAYAANVVGAPTFTMRHVGTLMKFTIVNKQTEAITPASLTFTFADNSVIAGISTIDFATGVLTATTSSQYTNTTLTLKDAPTLATNETLATYCVMIPFTIASGKTFNITVADTKGRTSTQKMTPNRDIVFTSGKVNTATLNFKLDPTAPAETVTGNWTATKVADTKGLMDGKLFFSAATSPKESVELNKLVLTTSYEWASATKYLGFSNNAGQGLQIGASNNGTTIRSCRKATFTSTNYGSKVAALTLNMMGTKGVATSADATINVSVNGKAYSAPANILTAKSTNFVFTPDAADGAQMGEIIITITNPTAAGGYYFSTFSITAGE